MNITKAVITAAGHKQRTLPLQTLIDRDGGKKAVLEILIEEILKADVTDIGLVVRPGDEDAYAAVAGDHAGRLTFLPQTEPLGYAHAIAQARSFTGGEPFLHLVGDHLFVSQSDKGCAAKLLKAARAENCAVSAVKATRESDLPFFGTIGGQRLPHQQNLYRVQQVIEKPTPTAAEEHLIVSGLRASHYLCFFGMHVLTPTIYDIIEQLLAAAANPQAVTLSDGLNQLAQQEQVLALQVEDLRYDLGEKYGLLEAQLALGLYGQDRDELLTRLVALLANQ